MNNCEFCNDIGFKTNGKAQLICESRANTGKCKTENKDIPLQITSKQQRNNLCSCGSGKKYKKCCINKT